MENDKTGLTFSLTLYPFGYVPTYTRRSQSYFSNTRAVTASGNVLANRTNANQSARVSNLASRGPCYSGKLFRGSTMQGTFVKALALLAGLLSVAAAGAQTVHNYTTASIVWDPTTQVLVQNGGSFG